MENCFGYCESEDKFNWFLDWIGHFLCDDLNSIEFAHGVFKHLYFLVILVIVKHIKVTISHQNGLAHLLTKFLLFFSMLFVLSEIRYRMLFLCRILSTSGKALQAARN